MKQLKMTYKGNGEPFAAVIRQLTGLTDEETWLLISMGGAYVGKHRCKDGDRLIRAGDQVQAYFRLPLEMKPVPFDPEWILRDNRRTLVAAKPAGIPTQGRRDADYMAFYEILKQNLKGYLGLHHRLDQGTSGLMLFTRDKALNVDVSRLFHDHLAKKRYLAVVVGDWDRPDSEIIDAPIGARRGPHGTRQEVMSSGKKAVTRVVCLGSHGGLSLVEAQPLTGRTHQVRVHLSHLGLPLLGDTLYGGPPASSFFLHCFALSWPATGRLRSGNFLQQPPAHWREALGDVLSTGFDDWWSRQC